MNKIKLFDKIWRVLPADAVRDAARGDPRDCLAGQPADRHPDGLDLQPVHLWGLAFQIVVVVMLGFVFWLWLLSVYPAASVAAFSFLGPVFGVFFGWALLGEEIGFPVLIALVCVAAGLFLINRPAQVPQKV